MCLPAAVNSIFCLIDFKESQHIPKCNCSIHILAKKKNIKRQDERQTK